MTFPADLKSLLIQILTKKKIRYSNGWSNYEETVNNPAALVIDVKNALQLQTVIKEINKLNSNRTPEDKITIRATAGWSDTQGCHCCLFPWNNTQSNQYNEGFSFSQVVGGRASPDTLGTDVIIRFDKKFHSIKVLGPLNNPQVVNPQSPIHQLPSSLVEVSAGVQIAELADFLRKNNLSLSTVSMIAWVTAVGLSGTAGHGTGRDEPAFSGLIESFKICDMDGVIREINADHPDFEALRGAHSGLLGIVLSIKLRAVKAFNLCETIELYHNTKEMTGKLGELLKDNQYVSIMGMPGYSSSEVSNLVPKWQIRKWNFTTAKPIQIEESPYGPDIKSFSQELETRIGASVLDYLLDSGLKHLLPLYLLLSAAVVTESRGTKPKVDFENYITHPQVAFPKAMRDVSYLIPVKDSEAGQTLEAVLQHIEELLLQAGSMNEYPVTYAIYVRYLKGTNGGLSTSATSSDDERILAIDVVTHPEAPGITHFEQHFLGFLRDRQIIPRNHLGKNFPSGVVRYDQFLETKAIENYKSALERWHNTPGANDGAERLAKSPFNTPYLQNMLNTSPSLTNKLVINSEEVNNPVEKPHMEHANGDCTDFLKKLHEEVTLIVLNSDEGRGVKESFLSACQFELANRASKMRVTSP